MNIKFYDKQSTNDSLLSPALKLLKNRGYKILTKLNEGSFAKVYLADFVSPTLIKTKLACKILEMKHRNPSDVIKKFVIREINILTQINHPHIIHVHSILQIGSKYYIFMRLAEQGDLLDYIFKYGMITEDQARVWTLQIALAVQYLHQLNIAHRDLKCENVLITRNYNVKLTDFGFARYAVDPQLNPILSSTYCGTLLYASPEILHGQPYNPKQSDLWSVGVILYVMLNNNLPFEEHNTRLLYNLQMNRSFKFHSKVDNVLSQQVKLLVGNLLEPDPIKRFPIELVLNSEWIAMDKRLTEFSPEEISANPIPKTNISEPKFKSTSNTVDEIKPFIESDQPRKSENKNVQLFIMP